MATWNKNNVMLIEVSPGIGVIKTAHYPAQFYAGTFHLSPTGEPLPNCNETGLWHRDETKALEAAMKTSELLSQYENKHQ